MATTTPTGRRGKAEAEAAAEAKTAAKAKARADVEFHYPDSDGKPMAENTLQFRWIFIIKEGIEADFADDPMVFVAGDLFWYPVKDHPELRTAPDTLAVFGRPKGHRGSYKQWEEGGIAPQVVFEVLSPGNRKADMTWKFGFYRRYGVEEYYLYDPDTGRLSGWLRQDRKLKPIAKMSGHVSPRLGIRFLPGEGPDNLTIIGRNGEPYLDPLELHQQRDAERERANAERERADTERERADTERERADAERERANRYAARLRELGAELD